MKQLLIVDTVCPKPYSSACLKREGMGGTEATVIRIAEKLGQTNNVVVTQHCRDKIALGDTNVLYSPWKDEYLEKRWDAVIVLRTSHPLIALRAHMVDTPMVMWMHDLAGPYLAEHIPVIKHTNAGIVAVSEFHKTQIIDTFLYCGLRPEEFPKIKCIYNPIENDLKPDETPVDKNKLVFFSSPHKGLDYTLDLFQCARNFNPDFKLYIANPGYLPDQDASRRENVINLGTLPPAEVLKHVREALCVFYPNHVFPETFGLVMAEANAVGTPVLTHSLGAAHEVLDHPSQMVDTRNRKVTLDKLMHWYSGNRPIVRGKPEFRLNTVAGQWRRMLSLA